MNGSIIGDVAGIYYEEEEEIIKEVDPYLNQVAKRLVKQFYERR